MITTRSPRIDSDGELVNGALIEFSEHGNPEGEPVLMLHGGWVAGALRPLAMEPAIPLLDALPDEGSDEYEQRLVEIRENASNQETASTRGIRFGLERRAGGPEELDNLVPGVAKQMYADAARRVRATSVATKVDCHRLCGLVSYPVLSQPILFLRGEDGNAAMPSIAEALEESQPDLDFTSIEDADHWFPLFFREQTATMIADFLRRNPL